MDNQFAVETQTFSDEFRRYFALLRQWAWLLTLAAVLCGVVAYLISRRMTPIYQASTTLLINEAPSNRSADYTSILTSERLARTYSEMLTKKPVVEAVIEELGLDVEAEDLQEEIQVDLVRDTQLIVVKVNDTDPQRAALIANTLVSVFSAQTQALQTSRYAASKENLEAQLARIDEQIQATVGELARLPNIPANNSDRERLDAALTQVREVGDCLAGGPPSIISIFAGRIADTGRDPLPVMAAALELIRPLPNVELLWASPRELLNLIQANDIGCHIITATFDILNKIPLIGKDLEEFSAETVQMFRDDALKAGYQILYVHAGCG